MTEQRRRRKIRGTVDNKVLDGYFPPSFPGYLIAEEVKALVGTLRISVEELMEKLLPIAASRAIVPISGFKVGAVCRGESGSLYFGANLEFPGEALQNTVHAEQAAIANAISYGETGIRAITISAAPCGGCRQFMNELRNAEKLKIQVPKVGSFLLGNLLPSSFGPGNLGRGERLMDPQDHPLQLVKHSNDKLVLKALEAASSSYAPYSSCYSAVALEIGQGYIFTGTYAENAAYNNSLLPHQAALAVLIMRAYLFSDIKRAVFVQAERAKIDLASVTRQAFLSLTQAPLEIALATLSAE